MADDLELETGSLSAADVLDELNKEDEVEDKKEEVKEEGEDILEEGKKEEDKEETDEDKEEEEEIEIEDTNEFHSVPSRKEILKAYPDIYKKFPAIEKAIYREQQYSEIFPTLDDARAVRESIQNYQNLEASLVEGKSDFLLKTLKNNAPDSLKKITDSFLETLAEVDEKSYSRIITKVVKGTLMNALNYGKRNEDENLQKAAQILHRAIYGTNDIDVSDIRLEDKKSSGADEERARLENERIQFQRQMLDVAVNDVTERSENLIRSTIDKHIDPKGQMSDYLRSKAVEDAYSEIHSALLTDKRFRAHIDRLWKEALDSGGPITEAHKTKIRNAIISRARPALPNVITNARNKALKGIARKRDDVDEKPLPRGRDLNHKDRNASNAPKFKSGKDIPHNISTKDFLNMD